MSNEDKREILHDIAELMFYVERNPDTAQILSQDANRIGEKRLFNALVKLEEEISCSKPLMNEIKQAYEDCRDRNAKVVYNYKKGKHVRKL